jgi:hypothetical protein
MMHLLHKFATEAQRVREYRDSKDLSYNEAIQNWAHSVILEISLTDPMTAIRIKIALHLVCGPSDFWKCPVVIYGPQGCGKTEAGLLLRAVFDKSHIADNFDPSRHESRLDGNTIALITADTGPDYAIPFGQAMGIARIFKPDEYAAHIAKFQPTEVPA